ncbi:MAG: Gldg family protein [Victivallales bacterium]|nr:Gldg family protein [Victivallales bacterium]
MRRPTGKIISSFLGALFIAGILVLLNALVSYTSFRADFTENKIYTLSDGSKRILSRLDAPVTIRFYYSRGSTQMPLLLKNLAERMDDLLLEYKQAGMDNIHLQKLDPQPFSDAEDSAILDGVSGQQLSSGDKIYLGLAISCGKNTVSIPFISPEEENMMEYRITSAITEVFRTTRPKIGVMSALPVMGGPPTQEMIQKGQFQMMEPWMFIKQLEKHFEIVSISMDADKIEDVDMLLVFHPSGISDTGQFAIDQYILRGGNMLAFLDPVSLYASAIEKPSMGREMASSSLDKLLKAWGLGFDQQMVVADALFGRKVKTQTQELNYLTVLDIGKEGLDDSDVTTSQLNLLTMVFAGAFSGEPPDYLRMETLLKSTEDSCRLGALMANDPHMSFRNFKADASTYKLAVRLTGKFKTAFPEGVPSKTAEKDDSVNEGEAAAGSGHIKEGVRESAVILVGDSDILLDDICVQIQQIFNQKIMIALNDNLSFAKNVADAFCGDSEMIGIRCRPVVRRPFERVKKIQAEAEEEFKQKILGLESQLKETEQKINDMQKQRTDTERTKFLSDEQQAEMKKFRDQQILIRKEIKDIQKQFRRKVDALENHLKWFNIAMMPAAVFLFGIGVAAYRKSRSSAK